MYYEVKINNQVETADGIKATAELYIVKAESVRDAESRINKEFESFNIEICHVKKTKIADIIGDGGDAFYSAKGILLTIDEKSGKEKQSVETILVEENDFDHAKDEATKYFTGFMSFSEIIEIKKTKIIDWYEQLS